MRQRTKDLWVMVGAGLAVAALLVLIGRHIVRSIECDEAHCERGTPAMVRGMWSYECACIETPTRMGSPR